MIEKRFKLSEPNGAYLIDEDEPLFHLDDSDDKIVDLLNSLSEENEQLKRDNKEYIRGLDLRKVECQSWASDVRELREQNCQLEKENEQLLKEKEEFKSEILTVIDRKIKNNNSNPSHDFQIYSKVNQALNDVKENLRDIIEEF